MCFAHYEVNSCQHCGLILRRAQQPYRTECCLSARRANPPDGILQDCLQNGCERIDHRVPSECCTDCNAVWYGATRKVPTRRRSAARAVPPAFREARRSVFDVDVNDEVSRRRKFRNRGRICVLF